MMLCGAVAPPRMHVVVHYRGEGSHGVVATYTVVTMGGRRKSTNGVWAGQVIREAREFGSHVGFRGSTIRSPQKGVLRDRS